MFSLYYFTYTLYLPREPTENRHYASLLARDASHHYSCCWTGRNICSVLL